MLKYKIPQIVTLTPLKYPFFAIWEKKKSLIMSDYQGFA